MNFQKETWGIVVSVSKQWWLKIKTKSVRVGVNDGVKFPYIIKVKYVVDGKEFFRRKWVGVAYHCPKINESIPVFYNEEKPKKSLIKLTKKDFSI
jgi:hypothetical protein